MDQEARAGVPAVVWVGVHAGRGRSVRVARAPKLDTMQWELLTYLRADVALLQPDHFYVIREVQTS